MSLLKPSIVQEGNFVGRDMAGRDIVHHNYYPSPQTPMSQLIAKYAQEATHDPALRETMEQLQNYTLPRSASIGLEGKLKLATWPEDEIEWATRWKETFAKRIREITFSPAAQEIVVYVLSKIYNTFKTRVRPTINRETMTWEQIQTLTIEEVIQPTFKELETNPLGICLDELSGALYFLTGNCHLRWDRVENATVSPST